MSYYIYTWSQKVPKNSSSMKLIRELGGQRILRNNSKFQPGPDKLVINWGSTKFPVEYMEYPYLNAPNAISHTVNKLKFFTLMSENGFGHHLPWYCTNKDAAQERMLDNNSSMVERHELAGKKGGGIRIVREPEGLQDAPLYTEYCGKDKEYRVHCLRDPDFGTIEIFYARDKRRKKKVADEDVNWQVRNLGNGFAYCLMEIDDLPETVQDACRGVFSATGLDFGAIDVGYHTGRNTAHVYEVNTAPMLTGSTVEAYANMIRRFG